MATEPVTVNHLASAIECTENKVEKALQKLHEDSREGGIRVQRQGKKVQLVSAPDLADYIETFLGLSVSSKLSPAALEALSIVAYQQPVTRPEIEAIRGVNSDGVLRTLLNKGLVEEVGRLDTVGHPTQFGTSFEFLRYFGLEKIEDLPELDLPELDMPAPASDNAEGETAIVDETETVAEADATDTEADQPDQQEA